MDILDIGIILLHVISCGFGFLLRPPKSTPFISGIFAALISSLFLLFILHGGPGGSLGTHGSWYLILSIMTVGIIPAITLGSAFWSGRFFSALAR